MNPKQARNHDHIRDHLLSTVPVHIGNVSEQQAKYLRYSERSILFDEYSRNRKEFGAYRYGVMGVVGKLQYDRITDMIYRLRLYREDGNDEHLVDVRNLAELEFVEGTHPKKHFAAEDDGYHSRTIGGD